MIVNDMFTVGHPAYCGLGATEVKWLLPAAKKVYEKFKKKFEYYQGIHEGGEATPRQDTLMCKITPLHRTKSCDENNIKTTGGYESFVPYKDVEERLKSVGYDVIVFVPSYDEDNGLITCGNAILSGNMPTTKFKEITK